MHQDTAIELWIILLRAYATLWLVFALVCHLGFPTLIFIHSAPLRGEQLAACVPCVALPAVRQGMDPGRLTAGSPTVPSDQQSFAVWCLTATLAASMGTDGIFWTEIPAFMCQTKQILP